MLHCDKTRRAFENTKQIESRKQEPQASVFFISCNECSQVSGVFYRSLENSPKKARALIG